MHETIEKFGYPETLLGDYEHWVVLLRPGQITAGAMVLACKAEAQRLPDVSPEAYAELPRVTGDLEAALAATLKPDKINYILLMMVDKYVHWHVLPRYDGTRTAAGVTFEDPGWPRYPALTQATELTDAQFSELGAYLRDHWPGG
ncbi:MAG: HIT family protein [Alphaproteobacteria bacterium]|nr:HIT family protein [Alphaproteobacteria bacterium]